MTSRAVATREHAPNLLSHAAALLAWVEAKWDWEVSARFRTLWLVSAWALVVMFAGPVWLVAAFGAVRFAGSLVQIWLNRRLARLQRIEGSDRWDWSLFVVVYFGSIAAALMLDRVPPLAQPLAMLPILVPVSLLQLRMRGRSLRAHQQARRTWPRLYQQAA